MFWSGNYIVVRELNSLLKEENVSLAQVLEADDILQECKADNKALIQFLTKPEILSELVSLITEEPRGDVELTSQYRHASAACEVLTSQLAALADRLSLDATLMHKLCDFINKEPPLNPLLASYFSKTVEMLLERSPKQDWYLYHIVCLRVLDFFKSRRDFLSNLLRHLATSAIADTFKCFVRLDDLFNKALMEWLEEHQFLENLIAIVCGSYIPEPLSDAAPAAVQSQEKADTERSEKETKDDSKREGDDTENNNPEPASEAIDPTASAQRAALQAERREERQAERLAERLAVVASANAAALLTDLILNGCADEGANTRPRTSWVLVSRLQSEAFVSLLLQTMFTSPPHRRHCALANGSNVLLALLMHEPILAGEAGVERTGVERAVAPHLPLLHQALLTSPALAKATAEKTEPAEGDRACASPVGWPRVRVAALVAQLAVCEADDVPSTLLTLGTPGVLCDMFFQHPDNNFLHAEVYTMVKNALNNAPYKLLYAKHLLVECDLLTRLMDVYEENENKKTTGRARSGYMGHVILLLRRISRALTPDDSPEFINQLGLPDEVLARWTAFDDTIKKIAQQHDTPLGGYYPSENVYEVDVVADNMGLETSYEIGEMGNSGLDDMHDDDIYSDDPNEMLSGQHSGRNEDFSDVGGVEKMASQQSCFLELAQQRFDDDMWDDTPEEDDVRADHNRTEHRYVRRHRLQSDLLKARLDRQARDQKQIAESFSEAGADGWADFDNDPFAAAPVDAFAAPIDPFASTDFGDFNADEKFDATFPPCTTNELSDSDFTSYLSIPLSTQKTTTDQKPDLIQSNIEHVTNEDKLETKSYASALKSDTSETKAIEKDVRNVKSNVDLVNSTLGVTYDVPVAKTDTSVVNTDATVAKTDTSVVNTDASVVKSDTSLPDTDVSVLNADKTVTLLPAEAIDDNAVGSDQFKKLWTSEKDVPTDLTATLQENLSGLHLEPNPTSLASNLLTAMSSMTPAEIANIVNANTGGESSSTNIDLANKDETRATNIDIDNAKTDETSATNIDSSTNIDNAKTDETSATNIDIDTDNSGGMGSSNETIQTDES